MGDFIDLIGRKLLFFDGAMGTELQKKGLSPGEIPELWNQDNPDIVMSVHRSYVNAGANLLKTNTFGANDFKFAGSGYSTENIITAAVHLAKKVAAEAKNVFVCLDLGPLGKLLKPYGDLDFEKAVELFAQQVRAGTAAGTDAVLIETMGDTAEMKAAILAVRENCDLPLFVTMTFDEQGRLLNGADIETATRICSALGVTAVGFNCGLGPDQVLKFIDRMKNVTSLPLIANPNAGMPREMNGKTIYDMGPDEYAQIMKQIIAHGVSFAGGCCGTAPEHIRSLVNLCGSLSAGEWRSCNETYCTSYCRTVMIDEKPKIIGERINPTGKTRLSEALKNKDVNFVCRMGLQQAHAGAHILDVNTGGNGIDEEQMLAICVNSLQGILDLPLQIDSSNPVALEKALRIYNGVPLLNSVNGKKSVMDSVLPLAAKYGATVVALTLDDKGIPDDVAGRITIAEKISCHAEKYGISKNRIVVDPLALTMSTGKDNVRVVLETLKELKKRNFRTLLGVSNVSFGLPGRDLLNSTFFTMAMQSGLSLGIINPTVPAMINAYFAYCVLQGWDENCLNYITKFTLSRNDDKQTDENIPLYDCIVKGMVQGAEDAAIREFDNTNPMGIINDVLIPALNEVGKGFAEKKVFLPQLLMSADAAKAAFEVIRQNTLCTEPAGAVIVLATVEGDIHDIGKNIVKSLLENYNFKVIDLGKDVPVATVVEKCRECKPVIVGLSALMTTTVKSMEKTIAALHLANIPVKIIVGGAVLTKEYAEQIGADAYAANAVDVVNYAKKLE